MTHVISQRELRNDSGRIMRELDEGRTFVISRNGRPVGELRPLRRERLVDARVALAAFGNAPGLDSEAFRRDLAAYLDESVDPRG